MKDLFKSRSAVIQIILLVTAFIFIVRLFYVQVIDTKYVSLARNNAIKAIDVYPTRGFVYDRNGELIVYNEAIYDLMVIPRQAKNVDSVKLCELLRIPLEKYTERWKEIKDRKKNKGYSEYKAQVFWKQVSQQDYSRLQEFLYRFPGFYGQVRTIRHYPHKVAATVLGDVGEVDDYTIEKSKGYYKPGDYVGKSGIEKVYEKELGGRRGKRLVFVDVHNREQGSFADGKYDTLAIPGSNVVTTLDIALQEYGEALMRNKKGSIVAIEPSTGEILALVSSPGYDPNLLCGAVRGENFRKLSQDTLLPLYCRPTLATYPPGSTFKSIVALIALEEGVQTEDYGYPCSGMYYFAGLALKCSHRHPSAGNIVQALQHSCNPYFWQTFRNTVENRQYKKIQDVYSKWVEYCNSFGLGIKTGIDLPSEAKGNIPTAQYFNKIYGERNWYSSNIISLGIGQGEILVTPLQMANMYAAIANRGYWYTPHVVKKITDPSTGKNVLKPFEKHITKVSPEKFNRVVDGLYAVVEAGTARSARIEGVSLCGKTGTAQNPHGDDHSMFAGFAPKDSPRIAIAVVVENGGFGASFAAPIASLMVEKYLNDTIQAKRIPLQERMMNSSLLHKYGIKDTASYKKTFFSYAP
ncbi:MAG: penicillin-binding protein 2 [Chitinophagales bacterium]|nr:penicillin-binding protein 2 [Chitinophagales bacterium]MDW8274510.1 penicillin-binding protein 2 [Chitinophagales bacterium]